MKLLFFLLICPLYLLAQPGTVSPKQITGLWKGYITTSDLRVPYELVLSEDNGAIKGWSFTTFSVRGSEIVTMKKVKVSVAVAVITEDDDNLFNTFPQKQLQNIIQINTLTLEEGAASSKLTGTFQTKTPRALKPAKGTVFLEKKNTPDSSRLIAKMDELDLTRSLSFSFNVPTATEPAVASLAVNEKPLQEKVISPPVSPTIAAIDTVPIVDVALLNKPTPSKAEVINTTTATSMAPAIKNKQVRAVAMAPIKPAVVIPDKPIAKTIPTPVPAKPRADAIVAKPAATAPPVAKAKVILPVAKQTPPAVAVAAPAAKSMKDNIAVAPAIDLKSRKIEIIDQLTIVADSLQFTLYDNGEVDGDTVSIIMNGKTIVSRQGLSTTPFTKTIYLTPDMGDSVQLVMYAENLGTIAPNTGFMILNYDKKRREVRFSGDLSKNAAITLRRKEKE